MADDLSDDPSPIDPARPGGEGRPGEAFLQPDATSAASPPLPGDVERTELPERVVPYWRLTSILTWIPLCAVPVAGGVLATGLPTIVRALLVVVPFIVAAFDVVAVQPRRRAIWWYAVGDEQIDLQHGWPIVTRTVIPMTRVQHVELEQGPLARKFTLAQLEIHTAAGAVKIPALDDAEGHRIRQKIADLARIADDL